MSDKIKQALRALIGARSEQSTVDALAELCPKEGNPNHDRALALVGGVFLDDALQGAISRHLMPERVEWAKAQLFGGELAPLSTMASRTRMAFALGIIT